MMLQRFGRRAVSWVMCAHPLSERGSEQQQLAPHEKFRLRERTAVERVFSRLKDEYGAASVRVSRMAKVMTHLMFGILALTADRSYDAPGASRRRAPRLPLSAESKTKKSDLTRNRLPGCVCRRLSMREKSHL